MDQYKEVLVRLWYHKSMRRPKNVCISSRHVLCHFGLVFQAIRWLAYQFVFLAIMSKSSSSRKSCRKYFSLLSLATLLTAPGLVVKGVTFIGARSWLHLTSPSSSSSLRILTQRGLLYQQQKQKCCFHRHFQQFPLFFYFWITCVWRLCHYEDADGTLWILVQ